MVAEDLLDGEVQIRYSVCRDLLVCSIQYEARQIPSFGLRLSSRREQTIDLESLKC